MTTEHVAEVAIAALLVILVAAGRGALCAGLLMRTLGVIALRKLT